MRSLLQYCYIRSQKYVALCFHLLSSSSQTNSLGFKVLLEGTLCVSVWEWWEKDQEKVNWTVRSLSYAKIMNLISCHISTMSYHLNERSYWSGQYLAWQDALMCEWVNERKNIKNAPFSIYKIPCTCGPLSWEMRLAITWWLIRHLWS